MKCDVTLYVLTLSDNGCLFVQQTVLCCAKNGLALMSFWEHEDDTNLNKMPLIYDQ